MQSAKCCSLGFLGSILIACQCRLCIAASTRFATRSSIPNQGAWWPWCAQVLVLVRVVAMPRERPGLSICPMWGTPQFKGCKFCRRSREHSNPAVHVRADRPFLPFRSDRHPECLPCMSKMRKHNPALKSSHDKNVYAEKLTTCAQAYEDHVDVLLEHEKIMRGEAPRVYKKRVDGLDVAAPQVAVSTHVQTGLELKKLIGVMWPASAFEDEFKRKPHAHEISTIAQGPVTLTGVLLPKILHPRQLNHG